MIFKELSYEKYSTVLSKDALVWYQYDGVFFREQSQDSTYKNDRKRPTEDT
jgi:hypothetical protein